MCFKSRVGVCVWFFFFFPENHISWGSPIQFQKLSSAGSAFKGINLQAMHFEDAPGGMMKLGPTTPSFPLGKQGKEKKKCV